MRNISVMFFVAGLRVADVSPAALEMKKGLLVWWILLQYECPPPLRHSGRYYAAFCWQSASAQRDF